MNTTQKSNSQRYQLPPKHVLPHKSQSDVGLHQQADAERAAQQLNNKLQQFGLDCDIAHITVGPVVTLFEFQPKSNVRISRILALEDDLALVLEAQSMRIIAPIPGKSVIGFEVANRERQPVHFADIIRDRAFRDFSGALPLVIGKNTTGDVVIEDLSDMPHVLVAGFTGSGKSVAMNTMVLSLLCARSPDELQLILIDPKRLEFAPYADIPHLLFPIVTQPKDMVNVFKWAVQKMEERYQELADAGARNIEDYHRVHGAAAMPFIVMVIDELADIMLTGGKDVELLIVRLTQMARAAGIHLIIATQRPSVDIITGLIKVNVPARIGFKVASKVDSRTILDSTGAEKLLGKGDMLYLNSKGEVMRAHGALSENVDVATITDYIRKQRAPVYQDLAVKEDAQTTKTEDALYDDVMHFVQSREEVSISLLQRMFSIGYNRSARLIDSLESEGIITPPDGGKMRKVAQQR
jgi:S-DNA-T family DNA segregation ATPase FtsK/SpoIIIE